MHHHRWLLLRIVVVLTLKVKIRVVRKYEREPDCASNPAPLLVSDKAPEAGVLSLDNAN